MKGHWVVLTCVYIFRGKQVPRRTDYPQHSYFMPTSILFHAHLHSIHLIKVVDEKLQSSHYGPLCLLSCDLQKQCSLLPGRNCDVLTVVVVGLA